MHGRKLRAMVGVRFDDSLVPVAQCFPSRKEIMAVMFVTSFFLYGIYLICIDTLIFDR